METLKNLEVFEIEVLEIMNSLKILDCLYFGGGTMLRLCHNLNRFSTDLDFWLDVKADPAEIFSKLKTRLKMNYDILDSMNKRNTILFEIRSSKYIRNLKIEIRKDIYGFDWERKIAFSRFANKQVIIRGLTLNQMMRNKIEALISRKIIRDAFDIEFLLIKGVELSCDKEKIFEISKIVDGFTEKDFKVTLGAILESEDRKFYTKTKFKILKEELIKKINLGKL
jgi:predicted nucleotidyltransferase component of viral defense system